MPKHPFRATILAGALLTAAPFIAPIRTAQAAPQKVADGAIFPINGSFLKLTVLGDDIIRVSYAPSRTFFARRGLMTVKPQPTTAKWSLQSTPKTATLATSQLKVNVDLTTGTLAFYDSTGKPILREKSGGRVMEAAQVAGENTSHVRQQWESDPTESLYGMGQNQLGLVDIKGYDLELWQRNTSVTVPFLVSSKGYGLLWDNTSYTRFGDLRQNTSIPADQLFGADGKPGGLTGSYFSGASFGGTAVATRVDPVINIQGRFPEPTMIALPEGVPARGDISVRWEGTLVPKQSGDHIFDLFSNGQIKMTVDNRVVMDQFRQSWLPHDDVAKVRLEAGKSYKIKLEWIRNQGANTFKLGWKTPTTQTATSIWSEVGDGVDYYFVYGPKLDKVVSGYRRVTGRAALMPEWSFGLWQSRQRYEVGQASLDVIDQFRTRKIPFDNIVQDWQYWPRDAWGSHKFDPIRFPDPQKWIDEIHAKNAHLMISVWGKFYTGTDNFNEMNAKGYLYQPNLQQGLKDWIGFPYTFYDAFNPDARKLFWSQMDKGLFSKGIDAWWMDATEPDLLAVPNLAGHKANMAPTAGGTGARALNGYPLV
ncbi:MAG TPA: TIM-barrel domain-containing protein, partial [Abditibacterium sp.]